MSNCAVESSDLMHSWLNGLANRLTSDASMPQDARPESFREIRLCLPASTSKTGKCNQIGYKTADETICPASSLSPSARTIRGVRSRTK